MYDFIATQDFHIIMPSDTTLVGYLPSLYPGLKWVITTENTRLQLESVMAYRKAAKIAV